MQGLDVLGSSTCGSSHGLRDIGRAQRHQDNARLLESQIVLDALEAMKLSDPEVSAARWLELKAIRRKLAN